MYDFIIVGQGLAGSAVALQLMERNYQILVIDNPSANHSSRIAAGLFNPITGRKMVKTWMADTIFPYLHEFYALAESKSQEKFFYPCPIYRPFVSVEEQNDWMAKSAEPGYTTFIDRSITQPGIVTRLRADHRCQCHQRKQQANRPAPEATRSRALERLNFHGPSRQNSKNRRQSRRKETA